MHLEQIYPKPGDDTPTTVDIIAVHGLNPRNKDDHARLTWTKDGRCWLQDDLGPDLKYARVFLFEYNSYPVWQGTPRKLVDTAEGLLLHIRSYRGADDSRPIIFVAHSLGGLLVKSAFILAQGRERDERTINAVRQLVFFAVPHLGADKQVVQVAKGFSQAFSLSFHEHDFLKVLQHGSSSSYNLKAYFTRHLKNLPVLSLYETCDHGGAHRIIVDKESATFGVPSEDKIEVDADHSGICRFDTRKPQDKGTYLVVKTHIEDALGASLSPQPGTSDLSTPDRRSPRPQLLLEDGGSADVSPLRSCGQPNRSPNLPTSNHIISRHSSRSTSRVSSLGDERATAETTRPTVPEKPCVFRISRFDAGLSRHAIEEKLRRLVTKETLSYQATRFLTPTDNNMTKFHHAPFNWKTQTAVVEFYQRPTDFPETRNPDDNYRLPKEAPGWWQIMSWAPQADAHFHGLTPLGLSWSDDDPSEAYESSSLPWLSRAAAVTGATELERVRVDIIVLTPLYEHPYDYWRSENGSMWVADFLREEGFDGARILVWGIPSHDYRLENELSRIWLGNNPTILVEIPKATSAPLFSDFLHSRKDPQSNTRVVLVSDSEAPESSPAQVRLVRPVGNTHSPRNVRFPNNRDSTYRNIVDSLWESVEDLLMVNPPPPPSRFNVSWFNRRPYRQEAERKVKLYGPGELLSNLLNNLSGSGAMDTPYVDPAMLPHDAKFYGILNDAYFRSWREGQDTGSIQLVVPRAWNLLDFCACLPRLVQGCRIVRIDCHRLTELYGARLNHGKGAALIGPLLLWIARFIIETWIPHETQKALVSFIVSLFEASEPALKVVPPEPKDLPDALTMGIEYLGSNLAKAIAKSTADLAKNHDVLSANIVFVVDLRGPQKSPEQGRLLHCISEFHKLLRMRLGSRLLFTHHGDKELQGLLRHARIINDEELNECLSSLDIGRLRKKRPVESRYASTLEWFWENDQCKAWMQSKASAVLFLLGKPACGKSVLSQFVVNNLIDGDGGGRLGGKACASFFFHYSEPGLRTRGSMMQAVLYDILKYHGRFVYPHFQEEFLKLRNTGLAKERVSKGEEYWEESELERVMEKLADHPMPETYIVIDGLDEAKDPLSCARDLAKLLPPKPKSGPCLKFLIATQRNAQVEGYLSNCLPGSLHEITLQDQNESDIRQYATSFLTDSLGRKFRWKQENIALARDLVCDKSKGIFLWAKLAKGLVERYLGLYESVCFGDFRAYLVKIPTEISKLYKKLLGTLINQLNSNRDPDRRPPLREVTQMFRLAAQAQRRRPLSQDEFRDAYALLSQKDDAEQSGFEEYRHDILKLIPRYTANILEHYATEDVVDFLHPSAVEFLSEPSKLEVSLGGTKMSEIMREPTELPAIRAPTANGLFAMGDVCLWYLEHVSSVVSSALQEGRYRILDGDHNGIDLLAKRIDEYPLLVYAMEYFRSHVCDKGDGLYAAIKLFRHMHASPLCEFFQKWMLEQVPKEKLPREVHGVPENKEKVQRLINSVLHCAVAQGLATAARVALVGGAEVDSRSTLHEFNENSLCITSIYYREGTSKAIAQILLDAGADPNIETRVGGAPLHYAGKFMAEEVMKLLLDRLAEVDAKDTQGMTPLHRTVIGKPQDSPDPDPSHGRAICREASLPCAKILVHGRADVNAADHKGNLPIHWAAGLKNRLEFVEFLAEGRGSWTEQVAAEVNRKCVFKKTTPLHWASGYGNHDVVQYLIKRGADIRHADKRGKTAVNWASRYGRLDVLETLIQKLTEDGDDVGAFVSKEERTGRTPLIWASMRGHYGCVRLLVSAGAKQDHVEFSEYGMAGTALSWAVSNGHREITEFLLEEGGIPEVPEDSSRPLISWAAAKGDIPMIKLLLDKACESVGLPLLDLDEEDKFGMTPFMLAAMRGHLGALSFLTRIRSWNNKPANPFHVDKSGNTALLLAAGWGHTNVVKWLVETVGLPIDHANVLGDTALHRSARWGRDAVVGYLCNKGANPDLKNKEGLVFTEVSGNGGHEFFLYKEETMGEFDYPDDGL